MYFEIIGKIEEIKTMATGGSIRDIMRLQKQFGRGSLAKNKRGCQGEAAKRSNPQSGVTLV